VGRHIISEDRLQISKQQVKEVKTYSITFIILTEQYIVIFGYYIVLISFFHMLLMLFVLFVVY
jgi:hypothetical protein